MKFSTQSLKQLSYTFYVPGDQMNTFLNENWREVFKELSPVLFKVFEEFLTSTFNVINTQVSFNNMFPETTPS
jgi:hypothetical protein